ncbi:ArsR family transcriptional regulator [Sporolactobacillus shoreicorticis]|uniref:ArsR/SmtB family transcription factor n=1 Tax=Sporolactobacillus shoreicorticis TaxID=1923877 RepID=A0ABW5S103_9BACL|nr:ArsR family transcriptional regulator [Sporolactobacillus shoreicorticis]MCO7124710.1 ArsR family transcriptional regulator [Sporolactobacillus shoreicorticis]
MQLDISERSLAVYEVLASSVRLRIIQLLSQKKMNIKELAAELGISSAIVGRHVRQMENAGLVKSEKIPGKSGLQKVVILKVDRIDIKFPRKIYPAFETITSHIPIGHYSDFNVSPTCGLATRSEPIGNYDEPKYFMDPMKNQAAILWFTKGFIEYRVPNLLPEKNALQMIDIVLEISSEFPYSNNEWPSDITFYLNSIKLCTWTSPGDFSDTRGRFTPDWWASNVNQYGLLNTLRITQEGTYIENKQVSYVKISDFDPQTTIWSFKIEVSEDAEHVGGVTLFGKGFGNYDQDIEFTLYYG